MKNKEKALQTYGLEPIEPEGEERAWHGSELANHSLGLTQRGGFCLWRREGSGRKLPGAAQTKLHIPC